ncbi:Response regulator receiver protein [Nostocoides japonicum T1-X7]|uniref:Response regulator receiver protein n=1 Tax=Nostocoides japonicum T1-X7 TaxID=1194083 RepID=A0A077M0M2_9MICO|nr:Response regulator receiver protein [Tetrasphaera japonica T1-X7]CCH79391.1 Response regulator receiver protein [Tetrasphaera japonica T1-X7]
MIRVLLADDELAIRAGFRAILESDPEIEVVPAVAATGRQAVTLTLSERPDVVLMDIRMPELDGLAAVEQIRSARPRQAVLIVTTFGDDDYIARAVRLGVNGFLVKSGDPYDLIRGVKAAAAGGATLSPAVAAHLIEVLRTTSTTPMQDASRAVANLTPRERDVLTLLARGRSNAEIAAELFLVEGTVKGYLRDIFTRLGVRNRVQAAILAHHAGLA